MKNILAMVIGLTLGGSMSFLAAGCSTDTAYKRHQAHTEEWLQCAADRRGSKGCA